MHSVLTVQDGGWGWVNQQINTNKEDSLNKHRKDPLEEQNGDVGLLDFVFMFFFRGRGGGAVGIGLAL